MCRCGPQGAVLRPPPLRVHELAVVAHPTTPYPTSITMATHVSQHPCPPPFPCPRPLTGRLRAGR